MRVGCRWGCRVLGMGRAGRGGTGSGKGMGSEREGEGSNTRRLLTCGQDPGWREEPAQPSPATGLATRRDQRDPNKASWAGRAGTGWGAAGAGVKRGFGQRGAGSGRMLPPSSASNLADPCPNPCSSLICLSSRAVKLIWSPAKSPSSNLSPPCGSDGFSSTGLAGTRQAAAGHCQSPHGALCRLRGARTCSCRLPAPSPAAPRIPHRGGCR